MGVKEEEEEAEPEEAQVLRAAFGIWLKQNKLEETLIRKGRDQL